MEGRIARLESDVAHIQRDVADIKADLRGMGSRIDGLRDKMDAQFADMRDKMETGFTDIRQSIANLSVAMERAYGKSKVATIANRVWGLVTLGAILMIMARAFKWI